MSQKKGLFGTSKKNHKKDERAQLHENRKKILTQNSAFAIREAYVQLRTNLMYSVSSMDERGCRVFGVTSPNPSEGKSLTASNIAVSFAMLGKKTLLLDCDMRKPNVARLWRIQSKNGLSDLIAKVDICEVYAVEGLPLSIIPCGKIPPNPSEMLASAAFQNAIERFRRKYDYIIIDTPPINEVADAQIVSRVVDGMVLVIRSARTKQRDLAEAESTLQSAGSRICGVVINDLNLKSRGKYGYKYGYRYGYKYTYKYGYRNGYNSYGNTVNHAEVFEQSTVKSRRDDETNDEKPLTDRNESAEIDFHAHILPGCDHGSVDIESSLQQIRLAKNAGVDVICATSHFYGQQKSVEDFLERRARSWLELKPQLEPDSPRIILGADVLAFEGIDRMPHIEDLCLMGTNMLLLEMPFTSWSEQLLASVEALCERRDLRIVLAHVDRYERNQVEKLLNLERVKGQVNVSAMAKHLQGGYLREWIKEGKIIAVGSDIHGTKTGYSEWQTAKQRYPEEWKIAMQAINARF